MAPPNKANGNVSDVVRNVKGPATPLPNEAHTWTPGWRRNRAADHSPPIAKNSFGRVLEKVLGRRLRAGPNQAGPGWALLGFAGLGWASLGRVELGRAGLGRAAARRKQFSCADTAVWHHVVLSGRDGEAPNTPTG